MRNIKRITEKYEFSLDAKQISLLFFLLILLIGLSFSVGVMYGRGLKKIEKPEIVQGVEKPPEVLAEQKESQGGKESGSEKGAEPTRGDNYTFYNTLTTDTPPPGIAQTQEPQKSVVIPPPEEATLPEKKSESVTGPGKETLEERVPKPASEEVKTETAGEYVVQVVAYNERERARSMVKKLKSQGFNAFIEEGRSRGRRVFRVKIGYFKNRTEAEKALKELKKKNGINGMITK